MLPSPHILPRRRLINNHSTALNLDTYAAQSYSLKKGATFHSPSSPSSPQDPVLNIPSLPRRSATCQQELEDLAAAAGNLRLAHLIGAVDRSLSGLEAFSHHRRRSTAATDDSPLPTFLVNKHVVAEHDHMDVDKTEQTSAPQQQQKHHASDSGIASTYSSEPSVAEARVHVKQVSRVNGSKNSTRAEARIQSGINGVMAASESLSSTQQALSEYACRQIQKHIIVPIIKEEKLKAFHPLVSGIPFRVARKEITCLRDLEKVLLWLAPVRQYATMVSNSQAAGGKTGMPMSPSLVATIRCLVARTDNPRSERLELIGGLSRSGRNAELVVRKDGKLVSLRTGEEVPSDEEYHPGYKRSASEESDVLRSMARRRKSAGPIEKVVQKCRDCDKTFKRPCDLTKHEKTHSRPWKCSEATCKYHKYGWPTEKERDRHVNDKHSETPAMYKCLYKPCPYESKRESNCKQHMEKAHGWEYVRSKNNGKNPTVKMANGKTPPTPYMSTPGSHIFAAETPDLSDNLYSPSVQVTESVSGSDASPYDGNNNTMFAPISNFVWHDNSNDPASDFNMTFNDNMDLPPSWEATMSATMTPDQLPAGYQPFATMEDDSLFGGSFDWSNMDEEALSSFPVQLPTPMASVPSKVFEDFRRDSFLIPEKTARFSTHGQADAMLYSPYSAQDEMHQVGDQGFNQYTQELEMKVGQDFSLFDTPEATLAANDNMFPDMAAFSTEWDMTRMD